MSSTRGRMTLAALLAFVAGVAIAGAILGSLVFGDYTAMAVTMGVVVGGGLVVATLLQLARARTAGFAAMLAGLGTMLFGVAQIALVGLVYRWQSYTQPAWLQEFFYVVAGAVIAAGGFRLWRPRRRSVAAPTGAGAARPPLTS